jgi:hypothetical protein
MSDFFIQFSCILDVGTAENALRAQAIQGEFTADLYREEGGYPGFSMEVDHQTGPGALWIYSDEYGDPEHVIQFVVRCAELLSLKGIWGFTWSFTCSKPRVGCFGGGAYALDLGTGTAIGDIDCQDWLGKVATPLTEDVAKTALDGIAGQGGAS